MRKLLIFSYIFLTIIPLRAQLLLNEVMLRNPNLVANNEGNYPSWVELYNNSSAAINLSNYSLGDGNNAGNAWQLPQEWLGPNGYRLVWLSGENLPSATDIGVVPIDHWETIVAANETWRYAQALPAIPSSWKNPDFDDSDWLSAVGPIGYGDGDDATILPYNWFSFLLRKSFNINNTTPIQSLILHVDYDDGFVAYLNGVEIARRGLNNPSIGFFDLATEHEAQMYQGADPELIVIDKSLLINGQNVLSIQVNNAFFEDDDITMRAWLSVGVNYSELVYQPTPSWFIDPALVINYPNLNTDFKIKPTETLYLFENNTVADNLLIKETQPGHVQARAQDGVGAWKIHANASANAPNPYETCCDGYAGTVSYSQVGGFYDDEIAVGAIPEMPGQDIRFTLDGSAPTHTDPLLTASSSLLFPEGVWNLRARAFAANLLPGAIETSTYAVSETNTLPVLFLTVDSLQMFDSENGMYMLGPNAAGNFPYFGANFWEDTRLPAHFEYFTQNNTLPSFESDLALEINGGWSRGCDQKSFTFIADKDFGANDYAYSFPSSVPGRNSFDRINVRNSGNDQNQSHLRETLNQKLGAKTNIDCGGSEFASLYINGDYWGIYQLNEAINEDYLKEKYGVTESNIDIVRLRFSQQEAQVGTLDDWNEMYFYVLNNNLSDSANYQLLIDQYLDINNYIDYVFHGTYSGNWDWLTGSNNIKLWHTKAPYGRWRHIMWDTDFSFGFGFEDILTSLLDNTLNNNHEDFFVKVAQNQRFRRDFVNRSCDLLNTSFSPDSIKQIRDPLVAQLAPEMERQIDRWPYACWTGLTSFEQWYTQATLSIDSFLNTRSSQMHQQFVTNFGLAGAKNINLAVTPANAGIIKLNTLTLADFPFSGQYMSGNRIDLKANPKPGFQFIGWFKNGALITDVMALSNFDLTEDMNLEARFEEIPISQIIKLQISEINYRSNPSQNSGDWVEIYNDSDFDANLSGIKLSHSATQISYTFPQNTILGSHQYLVVSENNVLFEAMYPTVLNHVGPSLLDFGDQSNNIYIFDTIGNLITAASYNTGGLWPRCAQGLGRTLERNNFDTTITVFNPEDWRDGCMFGSPGVAPTNCNQNVVFNEINYNSIATSNAGDWIELYNPKLTPIDISNWQLSNLSLPTPYIFPENTVIQPNEYLILAAQPDLFIQQFPWLAAPFDSIPLNFSAFEDVVTLADDQSKLQLSMFYKSLAPWPSEANSLGYTLELIESNLDVNNSMSWNSICYMGTPWSKNGICLSDTGNLPKSGFLLFPNPANNQVNIQIPSLEKYEWEISNLLGEKIMSGQSDNNSVINNIGINHLADGAYQIFIKFEKTSRYFSKILIIQR